MKINICKIFFIVYLIFVSAVSAFSSGAGYQVPIKNGRVVDKFRGNDEQDREVLIIMDAHCNYEAQKNIADLLADYTTKFKPVLIGFEGAAGIIDVSDISRFPIRNAKEYVLDHFMKKGKINGVEYFNVLHKNLAQNDFSENSFVTVGVEDPDFYLKNLNAYNLVKANSLKPLESLEYLTKEFDKIAQQKYSFLQKQFNDMDKARRTKQISYLRYCKYLLELSAETQVVDISPYKSISLVAQSLEDERKIDTFRLEFERKKIVHLLALKDLDDESVVLNNKFKLGGIAPFEYYARLKKLCGDNHIDLTPYKQVNIYMGYLDKVNAVDHSKLYSETMMLSNILAKEIFDTSLNRNIYLWNRRFYLLSKLFSLDLSPSEFEFLNTRGSWLNIKSLKLFLSQLSGGSELSDNICKNFSVVCSAVTLANDFYKTANHRNKLLINNLLSDMDIEGERKAVLVVGGFHIKGISSLLKNSGISYYVVSPNMRTYDHQGLYESRLNSDLSVFEKNIESAISQLADQSTSTITSSFLAVASLLADNSLAKSGVSKVFRVELKSILTVEGILAIEQAGLYNLPELRKRIETVINSKWAEKDFKPLEAIRVFRDFDGELIIELKINGVIYTFAGYISQFFNKINGKNPERVLWQFKINGNTLSVISGSEIELSDTLLAANKVISFLSEKPMTDEELSEKLSMDINILKPLLVKWIKRGVFKIDSSRKISLTQTALNILPVVRQLSSRFYADSSEIETFNEQLKDNLRKLKIREIIVDSAAPLSVLAAFFTQLSGNSDEISADNPNRLLFTLVSDERVYYAQLVNRGEAHAGVRLEFRIVDNVNKSFDEKTRDEKLASIYGDTSIMDEILNSADETGNSSKAVNLNITGQIPDNVMPLSFKTEYENLLTEKLCSYIGSPDEFSSTEKALIFDLDGTLALRTQYGFEPISKSIIKSLKSFIDKGIHVVVVSGQPYEEIERRFLGLFEIRERRFVHLYPNNGSAGVGFDKNGERIDYYEQRLTDVVPEKDMESFTNKLRSIAESLGIGDYETRFGDDQITFRLPNSTNLERETLFQLMKKYVHKKYSELKIAVAGRYSIDITLNDKSDAVRDFLNNRVQVTPENVLFFGDTYQGNDAPLSDGSPDSTHFHVGTLLPGEEIMPNVIQTDAKGVETTNDILLKLDHLITMLATNKIDPQTARRIINNLNNYYDFYDRFSIPEADSRLKETINRDLTLVTYKAGWEVPIPILSKENLSKDFIGVYATGVNLSYITAVNPEKSIIIDSNPWISGYFVPLRNVLIDIAATRVEYISMLSAKPIETVKRGATRYYRAITQITGGHTVEISENASIDEIYNFFAGIPFQNDYLKKLIDKVKPFFPENKRKNLEDFWKLQVKKDAFQSLFMLKSMGEADDRVSSKITWISDEEKYQALRQYVRQGRLFAVSSDWLNTEVARVFSVLNVSGDKVSLVNLADLMDIISSEKFPDGSDPLIRLMGNIASLPKTEKFVILTESSEQNIFKPISSFNGTSFEFVYAKRVNARENKPVDSSIISLNKPQYTTFIVNLLNNIGREDLASFYAGSSDSFRSEILNEFSKNIIKIWDELRRKIRNSENLSNDEHIKSLELTSVLGYGLKDMEKVIGVFDSPAEYFLNLLALPFAEQGVFLSRTLADMKSILADTVSYFSRKPDIVLVDTSFLTARANTFNIALGQVIKQFKKEHKKTQGRRVIVVAVDSVSNGIITAKQKIDRFLYTRGDASDVFDQVLAFPFDSTDRQDNELYRAVKNSFQADYLRKRAVFQLKQDAIETPSQTQINEYIENFIIEKVKEKKLQSVLISRFGMNIENISSRITVLSYDAGFLADFADSRGAAIREIKSVEPSENADVSTQPSGIFLIDILRSIGTQSLPAGLNIAGVRSDVTINDEYRRRGFDAYIYLLQDLYSFYTALGMEKISYGNFIDEIDRARIDGRLNDNRKKYLKTSKTIKNLYKFKTDDILTDSNFVTFLRLE